MAEIHREADIVRDPETGRVTGYVEHVEERPRRGGGGLIFGLLLGALLVAGGIAVYATNQGGYQRAGAEADSAVAEARAQTAQAADRAGAAIDRTADKVGDAAERAGNEVERAVN